MTWFLNHYRCDECRRHWSDEWSCGCDDECPRCGARDMTPYRSDDLTKIVEKIGHEFVVLWSPETTEDDPDYCEVGRFPTRAQADAFLDSDP